MAGLYGDLPTARDGTETTAWAAPKSQAKKPNILAPPPSLLRAGAGRGAGRTPIAGGRGAGRAGPGPVGSSTPLFSSNHVLDTSDQGMSTTPTMTTTPQPINVPSIFASIQDEYDPMRPNDYEKVLKERERAKREAEAEAERLAKLKEMESAMEKLKQQEEGPPSMSDSAARAAALNVSGEEAFARRGRAGSVLGFTPSPYEQDGNAGPGLASGLGFGAGPGSNPQNSQPASDKGMTLAQKMLMKMGWKEGEGLGREKQGISTPLVMQKTNARAGVIVNAEPTAAPPEKRAKSGAQIIGTPSKVICLRNMVGPGEVDEELEEEVGMECTKYGPVTNVMIFEVTQPGYAPEEAVRIFVQFERMEHAMKALVDMQGRFFGGREVRCAFFSEERFAGTQLAPFPGEFDA